MKIKRICSLLVALLLSACSARNPGPDVLTAIGEFGNSPAADALGATGLVISAVSIPFNIAEIVNEKEKLKKKKKENQLKYSQCIDKINKGKDDSESLLLSSVEINEVLEGKKFYAEQDEQRFALHMCMD